MESADSGVDSFVPPAAFAFEASLAASDVVEGQSVLLTISASGNRTAPVTVSLSIDRASDVSLAAPSVTIPAGSAPFATTIAVSATDDAIIEASEAATITIGPFVSDDLTVAATSSVTRSIQIQDADQDSDVAVAFEILGVTTATTEGGATVQLQVSTSTGLDRSVDFSVATSVSGEAMPSVTMLSFDATHLSRTFTVTGLDDDVDDGDVAYDVLVGTHAFGLVNTDDDSAGVTIAPIAGTLVERAAPISVSFRLDSKPVGSVTVTVAADLANRVVLTPTARTFDASNWNVAQSISIGAVDSAVADGDQTVQLTATTSSVTDTNYAAALTDTESFALHDPSVPTLYLTSIAPGASEERGIATLFLRLGTEPTANVQIDVTSSDTNVVEVVDDAFATVASFPHTFTSANWSAEQKVYVRCRPSASNTDQSALVQVTVSAPASSGSGYEVVSSKTRSIGCFSRTPTTLMSRNYAALWTAPSTRPSPVTAFSVRYVNEDTGYGPNDGRPDTVSAYVVNPTDSANVGIETYAGTTAAPSCVGGGGCAYDAWTGSAYQVFVGSTALTTSGGPFADLSFVGGTRVAYRQPAVGADYLYIESATMVPETVSVMPPAPWTAGIVECHDLDMDYAEQFIAFDCEVATTPNSRQIFVRDRVGLTTEHISHGPSSVVYAVDSFDPAISPDGRYVAFASEAPLVPEDTLSSTTDIYIYDRMNDTYRWYPIVPGANYQSGLDFVVTLERARVTWTGGTYGSERTFVLDVDTGYMTQASWAAVGVTGRAAANGACFDGQMDPTGYYVFASCVANNLVDLDGDLAPDDDTNGTYDIYRFPLP